MRRLLERSGGQSNFEKIRHRAAPTLSEVQEAATSLAGHATVAGETYDFNEFVARLWDMQDEIDRLKGMAPDLKKWASEVTAVDEALPPDPHREFERLVGGVKRAEHLLGILSRAYPGRDEWGREVSREKMFRRAAKQAGFTDKEIEALLSLQ